MDVNQTSPTDVESMKDKLRNVQRTQDQDDTTSAFAFEDEDGHLVKVYVPKDKAEEFKEALGQMLDDAERNEQEIAEVIYKLHQNFDIVNVEWCEGSIPEDEEVPQDPNAPVQNSEDAENKGFPETDPEKGDVTAAEQGSPDEVSGEGGPEMTAGADDVDVNAETDKVGLLDKVLSLLQARTDADRAKADAEKAKADVEASKVAAQAAAHYASSQEEILDMENFNKRQQEQKREATLQSKLIRYRHDLRKQDSSDLEDKINDPQFLLNMLSKTVSGGAKLGESMNPVTSVHPATPEEEELLHAEDWEQKEREQKQAEKKREKLLRYRHAKKKGKAGGHEYHANRKAEEEEVAEATKFKSVADIKNARFKDFLKAQGFDYDVAAQQGNN